MSSTYRSPRNGAINVWGVSILLVAIVAIQLLGETTHGLTRHRSMIKHHKPVNYTCHDRTYDAIVARSVMARRLERLSANLMLAMGASDKSETRNLLVSPFALYESLNMLLLGLRGETRDELIKMLEYDHHSEKMYHSFITIMRNCFKSKHLESKLDKIEPKLDLLNGVIGNRHLKLERNFEYKLAELFGTEVDLIDPKNENASECYMSHKSVLNTYNGWSQKSGLGSILESNDLKNEDLAIMLISALRVEAHWFRQFIEIPADSLRYKFIHQGKKRVYATGLTTRNMKIRHLDLTSEGEVLDSIRSKYGELARDLEALKFTATNLPLAGSVYLTIIEPSQEKPSLHELNEKLFHANGLYFFMTLSVLDGEDTVYHEARVTIPKFNFTSEIDLKDVLQKMGLERVFKRGEAEMAILSDGGKSYVSKAKQKAMIEVTMDGVKAAAANLMEISHYKNDDTDIDIEVHRPFLFVLRYKAVPLFVGQVREVL